MSKIKKLFAVVLCALGIFMLVGCSGKGAYMPNPFIDCKDMAAAKEIAGFDMTVQDEIGGCKKSQIQAVDKTMVQVFFENGSKEILVRKAAGANVSHLDGDYNTYKTVTSTKLDSGITVTVKGNAADAYAVATWSNGSYSYSVTTTNTTLTQEQVNWLANHVK